MDREATRGDICLRFSLPFAGVRWPKPTDVALPPERSDGLWQHSCVELFVAVPDSSAYREFNFAVDGRWAAYDFSGNRERVMHLPLVPDPQISSEIINDEICVLVTMSACCLPVGAGAAVNAAAVVQSDTGSLSYWAATHPCAQPDFHHRDGFVLTLT